MLVVWIISDAASVHFDRAGRLSVANKVGLFNIIRRSLLFIADFSGKSSNFGGFILGLTCNHVFGCLLMSPF